MGGKVETAEGKPKTLNSERGHEVSGNQGHRLRVIKNAFGRKRTAGA